MTRIRPPALLAAIAAVLITDLPAQSIGGLVWRNLGPFRGGRVVAVAGVPSQPSVFYMGTTGGGVWKTDDAGTTWRNVSDGFFRTGSVGAIAVAESNPNVVYVGMGESPVRINMSSYGDGVYRSDDGGETWRHLGLEASRQIGAVVIDPMNPDVAFVAAQGNHWAPSSERGVYGTTDGGRTWTKLLAGLNETTGAVDLKLDPSNASVLYAALWDHLRRPWQLRSGGPGSGLYKSTDRGKSWTRLTVGLPAETGKIGVAISATNPARLYAAVEAERSQHGLYRSDDAGASWRLINTSRNVSTRPWYYMHVVADPTDADVVYVPSQSFWKSTDGGRTFRRVRTQHGDAHALWINPANPKLMILGDDGGASVTHNGGETWSTLHNQPTGQFYRVSVDDRFPYRVYGAQQDNTTVTIASRSSTGPIGADDYHPVGGGEAGFVVPDPFDELIVYAGSEIGTLDRYDYRTGRAATVLAYPIFPEGQNPSELKHRFEVNAPVVASRHVAGTIYHGAQHLLRSTDRGQSWQVISPDLTRNIVEQQGAGGVPFNNERIDAHNALSYIAESPLDARVLWVGSDDGLVHLSRDGGATWTNVTPSDRGDALVNAIDASPHAVGRALVAINRSRLGQLEPLVYLTEDFGATWRLAVSGLPRAPMRVVREDPTKPGLLFAGNEVGVFVSHDGGGRWQSLQANLPAVPVTDLVVKGNDLVISTQGRGFWVLDDMSPLRSWTDGAATRLFPISDAYQVRHERGPGEAIGADNPPAGAIVYYTAAPSDRGVATFQILDDRGVVVAQHASPDSSAGLRRVVLDLATPPPTAILDAYDGEAPGYRLRPGRYTVRMQVGQQVLSEVLNVRQDPRVAVPSTAQLDEKYQLLGRLTATFDTMARTVNRFHLLRPQLDSLASRGGARGARAKAAVAAIDQWERPALSRRIEDGNDRVDFGGGLAFDLIVAIAWLDGSDPPVTAGFSSVTRDLEARWNELETKVSGLERQIKAIPF